MSVVPALYCHYDFNKITGVWLYSRKPVDPEATAAMRRVAEDLKLDLSGLKNVEQVRVYVFTHVCSICGAANDLTATKAAGAGVCLCVLCAGYMLVTHTQFG